MCSAALADFSEEELDGDDVIQLSGCAAGGSGALAEAALSSPARRLHSPLHPTDPNSGSPASTTPKNESLPELDLSHLKGLSVSATVSATSSMATLNTEQPNVGARLAAVLEQQPPSQQPNSTTTAAAASASATAATPPPSQAQAQHEPLASSGSMGTRPSHVRAHYPPFVGELDAELEYYGLKSSFYDGARALLLFVLVFVALTYSYSFAKAASTCLLLATRSGIQCSAEDLVSGRQRREWQRRRGRSGRGDGGRGRRGRAGGGVRSAHWAATPLHLLPGRTLLVLVAHHKPSTPDRYPPMVPPYGYPL